MLTKFIAPALVLSAALAAPVSAQVIPDAKIAVVDSERLFGECTACKAANTQLQAQRAQLQSLAQSLAAPLDTEAKSLQAAVNAANGKPDVALQQRIGTFQGKQQVAQQQVAAQEQVFQRNVAFVREQIGQKAAPIIDQVAQQRGATLAVDKGSTLYSAASNDITDGVLTQLNVQLTTLNTVAPVQTAPAAGAPKPATGAAPKPAAGTKAPVGR